MCDHTNLLNLEPTLYSIDECVREIHDFTIKKRQFMESSGYGTIAEANGFRITKATVSGLTVMESVHTTAAFINEATGLQNLASQLNGTVPGCPIATITFDTGLMNTWAGSDIEDGVRKMLEIEYIADDTSSEEKKINTVTTTEQSQTQVDTPAPGDCTEPGFAAGGTLTGHVYLINASR